MTDALADPHYRPHVPAGPDDGPRDIVILGSTGSIGTQAIDVVLRNPDRFRVVALSAAGGRVALLAEQAHRLEVRTVAVADEKAVPALREALAERYGSRPLPEILAGPQAATELAGLECHSVLNGITGSIGLRPTLAALAAGRVLILANKESLIVGGPLVKALARPGQVVPVDSSTPRSSRHCWAAAGPRSASWWSPPPAGRSAAGPAPSWPASPSSRPWPTRPGTWGRW